MKTSKCNLSIARGIALLEVILALPSRLPTQTVAPKSSQGTGLPPRELPLCFSEKLGFNLQVKGNHASSKLASSLLKTTVRAELRSGLQFTCYSD